MKAVLKFFWIFLMGSFLGCIAEEVWCLLKNKCYKVRKSLIYMPMIPIYGIAATLIVIIADIVGYNLVKVFFIGMVVSTIVEYASSYIQEKIFHTVSWDYSKMPFNINGRVNLFYSIAFGLYSVVFIKQFTLLVNNMTINMDSFVFEIISLIVFVLFMLDVFITLFATIRQKERREGIEAKNKIDRLLDDKYSDERLDRIYNNSVYTS